MQSLPRPANCVPLAQAPHGRKTLLYFFKRVFNLQRVVEERHLRTLLHHSSKRSCPGYHGHAWPITSHRRWERLTERRVTKAHGISTHRQTGTQAPSFRKKSHIPHTSTSVNAFEKSVLGIYCVWRVCGYGWCLCGQNVGRAHASEHTRKRADKRQTSKRWELYVEGADDMISCKVHHLPHLIDQPPCHSRRNAHTSTKPNIALHYARTTYIP